MKYISEYRTPQSVKRLLTEIKKVAKGTWNIMEVCGGQTHSLAKNGILQMLPQTVQMIHGPACPLCLTPRGFNRQSRAAGDGAKRDSLFLRRHDQSARQPHELARSKVKRRRCARFIFSLGGRRNSA